VGRGVLFSSNSSKKRELISSLVFGQLFHSNFCSLGKVGDYISASAEEKRKCQHAPHLWKGARQQDRYLAQTLFDHYVKHISALIIKEHLSKLVCLFGVGKELIEIDIIHIEHAHVL